MNIRTSVFAMTVLAVPGIAAAQGMSKEEKIKHEAEMEFKSDVMNRLKTLESKAVDPKTGKAKDSWTDFIRFWGDFRFRHETIDTETTKVRHRGRIRTRLNMEAKVNDEVKFGLRLATNEGGDPVSTNQTLTGGFSKKPVIIDAAFVSWAPMSGMTVDAGKMNQPFYTPGKTDLIWDGDLTPEGIAIKHLHKMEGMELFWNAAAYWINERSGAPDDTAMFGGQVGLKTDLGSDMKLTVGGSIYAYPDSKGEPTFFSTSSGFGNQTMGTAPSLTYAKKFVEVEAFIELATTLMEMPFSVFWDYVDNIGTGTDDIAWLAGFSLGKLSKPGDVAMSYNFRKVERNSVIGAFADSDGGGGGTNYRGHKVSFETQIAKNWTGGLTYFRNETGLASNADLDYDRFQFDFGFKF